MTQKEIDDYFREFIFGFVCGDLERCITEGKANFLVALGLLSYTEYLGGLLTGTLGLDGKSRRNFEAGLSLFDWNGDVDYYAKFKVYLTEAGQTKTVGIYKLFRCGMVHEYFGKGCPLIHNNADALDHVVADDQGIGWHEGRLRFHTNAYYRDFRNALTRYRELLRTDAIAASSFGEAVGRIEGRSTKPIDIT